ncbi:MAG: MCE family protein [Deltaproteobacteria bacterium]|nr:MAG: MCE family protein [Deltaproteobacteria bacterium]
MSTPTPGAQTARVGFLVFVALTILVATVMSLGGEQKFWERKIQYEVHFARTNGLQVGAPVSLTGVTIGSVAEMRFPPDPTASYIQVLVNVVGEAAPRIRDNSVATIRTFGLLGDRYIELSAGSPDASSLPPGGLISSIDPVDYEAVLGQSGDIVTNVVEVTASLRVVLQSIERGEGLLGAMVRNRELGESTLVDLQRTMANVQDTTRSLEEILQRLNRGEGVLGRLTRNTREVDELFTRVTRAAKSLDQLTDRLNRGRGTVGKLVDDEAYATRVLGNLDAALRDLKDVADKLDRGEGTLGKLVNDPSLYHEAKALVGSARRSWLLGVYKGVSGLWPFGGGGTEAPPDQPIGKPAAP